MFAGGLQVEHRDPRAGFSEQRDGRFADPLEPPVTSATAPFSCTTATVTCARGGGRRFGSLVRRVHAPAPHDLRDDPRAHTRGGSGGVRLGVAHGSPRRPCGTRARHVGRVDVGGGAGGAYRRIRIGHLVTCDPFRHPAVLAKMAATVDVLSGGRLELGLGWGSVEEELAASGSMPGSRRTGPPACARRSRSCRACSGASRSTTTASISGSPARSVGRCRYRRASPSTSAGGARAHHAARARVRRLVELPVVRSRSPRRAPPARRPARVSVQHPVGLAPDNRRGRKPRQWPNDGSARGAASWSARHPRSPPPSGARSASTTSVASCCSSRTSGCPRRSNGSWPRWPRQCAT